MGVSVEGSGVKRPGRDLLAVVEQEVDLGVNALKTGRPDAAVTFFQSAFEKLSPDSPFYDHLTHNLLLSYKAVARERLEAGDRDNALRFVNAALRLEIGGPMAADAAFRARFADAFQDLGSLCFHNTLFVESVACFRKSIAIFYTPDRHINLTNALSVTGQRGLLSDYSQDLRAARLGRHIFIACVPKSASTFLKDALVGLTGYRDSFMVYAAGQTEHEIYLPTLLSVAEQNTVTQQHCRASDATVNLMQAFGIKPVVLVRNVFDCVVSLLDFYRRQGAFYNTYFRADFESLEEATQIDLIIENVIPWYYQFVASWADVEKKGRLELKWLSYEDLIADKPAAIADVLAFYGLGVREGAAEMKVESLEADGRKIRFNKGVSGRGKTILSERQKDKIRNFARFYPSTEFGRIGS